MILCCLRFPGGRHTRRDLGSISSKKLLLILKKEALHRYLRVGLNLSDLGLGHRKSPLDYHLPVNILEENVTFNVFRVSRTRAESFKWISVQELKNKASCVLRHGVRDF
jgi:hypothetical protein